MFLAEIGDKTFILTMISYHELGACITFITAYVTLCAMHILAATLGWGISYVIPRFWTKLICTIIFLLIAVGMFIFACYSRNSDDVDVAFGRKGHSVALTAKEKVEVKRETEEASDEEEADNQAEGGNRSSEESDEDDDDSEEEGSGSGESGDDDDDEDSDEESESEEEVKAQHLTNNKVEEKDTNQVIFRAKSMRVTPKFQSLAAPTQIDNVGIY